MVDHTLQDCITQEDAQLVSDRDRIPTRRSCLKQCVIRRFERVNFSREKICYNRDPSQQCSIITLDAFIQGFVKM